ncbi:MAG: FecR family protein [Methylococcales bacterium]
MGEKQSSSASDEALAWPIRNHSGEMTRAERREFAAWTRAGAEHREAYSEAEMLWNVAGHLRENPVTGLVRAAPDRVRPVTARRFASVAMASVAGLCLILFVSFGLHWRLLADRVTGVEPQIWTLTEGSRLHLDADTALSVDFAESERRIHLYRGACWFTVAQDSRRPLRVVSGNLSVTALGTEFLVDLSAEEPYVAVSEHAVEASANHRTMQIEQGEGWSFVSDAADWRIESVAQPSMRDFRGGRLIVENRPLREVVVLLSRYRHGFLAIQDEELAEERISGVFDLHRPDRALDALRQILPVKLIRISPYLVIVTPH